MQGKLNKCSRSVKNDVTARCLGQMKWCQAMLLVSS